MPSTGGWIFVAVGAILLGLVIFEWRKKKKRKLHTYTMSFIITVLLTVTLSSCSTDPQPIRIGQDNCDFCKMTVSDKRFGAEVVTKKGKIYKFDDGHCLLAFLSSQKVASTEIGEVYFTNFLSPNDLINVKKAYFLQSPALKSPMNGNIAAFTNEDSLHKMIATYYGNKISWEDMQK